MKGKLVKVGNSRGVIIPSSFIRLCRLKKGVEIEIHENGILIKAVQNPREGWEKAFQEISEEKNRTDTEEFPLNDFDRSEWQW